MYRIRIVLGIGLLLSASCAFAQMGMGMMGGANRAQGMSRARHRYAMMKGIPEPYASARNPVGATAASIAAGKTLYERNCASCHGTTGRGDGPAAGAMDPAPSNLSAVVRMPIASDRYLDWTISEGGAPIGSAMPSYKTGLTRDQIWDLVLYVRTL